MLSLPPSAASANAPAATPNDRPHERPSDHVLPSPTLALSFASDTSVVAGADGSLPSIQPSNRSYLGALRGPEASSSVGNQSWIPVGVNDIVLTASNGVKALSLSKDFKEKLCKLWSNSVVVRLMGKNIGYSYLCHRLNAIWKLAGNLHIVDLDKNCFMVKFSNEQDYFKALTGGPWMILDHYLIVHQ
ncbi:hypothetical protein LINPERHAP1_LOCUS496 [Linum perenne]